MIYVSSDWHGWPLEKIQQLLQRAEFGEGDYLFVLGDVIDRGPDGVALLRWLKEQTNVQLLLGNHEAMMLACDFAFDPSAQECEERTSRDKLHMFYNWRRNGGDPTIDGLRHLMEEEPETLTAILEYVREAPLYQSIEVDDKWYVLVHGGINQFHPDRELEEYDPNDLLWARPSLDTVYYPDATVVFGHTPTIFYGREYAGKPVFTDTWICIDVGAAGGMPPMLLRLNDMKQFY